MEIGVYSVVRKMQQTEGHELSASLSIWGFFLFKFWVFWLKFYYIFVGKLGKICLLGSFVVVILGICFVSMAEEYVWVSAAIERPCVCVYIYMDPFRL